ncbi:DUF6650 family protein [Pseudomonas taetrolens]|uniref:DUF6650 family protein n=1 Tax=Pseudomonas taetrolens TaxID=47884 RepID=UPI0030DACB05
MSHLFRQLIVICFGKEYALKFERIYKNITGLSCPVFGIQWNAPVIEADEARSIIALLENKRVLFNPANMEDANHCALSILDIRSEITKALQALPASSALSSSLRRMRKSCLEFSNKLGHPNFLSFDPPVQVSILERELFKLREKFGISVAEISVAYGVDIDDGLASIIPFNNAINT